MRPSTTESGEVADALVRSLEIWHARHGRHDLPWRRDRAPYRIVVSEFMLQQTQVDRVVPLFEAFVARWPSFAALAAAPLADVVRSWKGLGYNSRAVRLHALARAVMAEHGGVLPSDPATLGALPGIGPYTLAAVRAFAFDRAVVALDTNLRRIFHRVRFGLEWPPRASAAEIERFGADVAAAAGGGFALNSALMDLGASVCGARVPKCLICPVRHACAAAPIDPRTLALRAAQSAPKKGLQAALAFERTTRYLRGRIVDRLRDVGNDDWLPIGEIVTAAAALVPPRGPQEVASAISALVVAGLVEYGSSPGEVRLRR